MNPAQSNVADMVADMKGKTRQEAMTSLSITSQQTGYAYRAAPCTLWLQPNVPSPCFYTNANKNSTHGKREQAPCLQHKRATSNVNFFANLRRPIEVQQSPNPQLMLQLPRFFFFFVKK